MSDKITGQLVGTTGFKTSIKGHTIVTDKPLIEGGTNLGPTPEDLIYPALIGSIGKHIITNLKEMKIDDFIIEIDNNSGFSDEKINIVLTFKGRNLNRNEIKNVVKNSIENQCNIVKMLRPYLLIKYDIKFET